MNPWYPWRLFAWPGEGEATWLRNGQDIGGSPPALPSLDPHSRTCLWPNCRCHLFGSASCRPSAAKSLVFYSVSALIRTSAKPLVALATWADAAIGSPCLWHGYWSQRPANISCFANRTWFISTNWDDLVWGKWCLGLKRIALYSDAN